MNKVRTKNRKKKRRDALKKRKRPLLSSPRKLSTNLIIIDAENSTLSFPPPFLSFPAPTSASINIAIIPLFSLSLSLSRPVSHLRGYSGARSEIGISFVW